jgi:hypothetical protein
MDHNIPSNITPSDIISSDIIPSNITPSDITPSDITPSDITIYLTTCDKTSYILPATIYLYKKFINTLIPHFKILGFTKPILPEWENVEFISLSAEPQDISKWSLYLHDYFYTINDDLIFLALDDFFPIDYINKKAYDYVINYMTINKNVGFCVVDQSPEASIERNELNKIIIETDDYFIYERKKHVNYQLVLQPGIWNRTYLCKMLSIKSTPWTFELNNTIVANNDTSFYNIASSKNLNYKKCIMCYCGHSALSSKWNGISVIGLKHEYIVELIKNKLIHTNNLLIGAWDMFVRFDINNVLSKSNFIEMCNKYKMYNWIQLYSDYY